MCGIAGILRLDGGEVERWRLEAMNRAMRHRGPDGEGFHVQPEVGLSHLRLAIIDLVTGDQPMRNEDGSVSVVFNGEIYNFQELKPILQNRGHTFRTHSDTEVLIHAYEEWGLGMLSRLNGMFAFAIYDCAKRKLLLARDRIGVKPLYYYFEKGVFVFASEMGGMVASGLIPRELDRAALELYLHYQYIPAPYSVYKATRKLAPAEYLELDVATGRLTKASYWNIATDRQPDPSRSLDDWLNELDSLMRDAVRIRLISDVPFGAFLSGGVDSGLVVAMMAQELSCPVRTFSIGLADGGTDELPYARQVAERFNTTHEEFQVSPEGLTLIPELCAHFGEPFADSSAVPTYYVSKMARTRVKMVLTGDGGDEMFAGYRSYSYLAQAISSCLPPALSSKLPGRWRPLARRLARHLPFLAEIARKSAGLFQQQNKPAANVQPWHSFYDISMRHFSEDERRLLLGEGPELTGTDYVARHSPYPAADSFVGMAQYCDVRSYLPGDILVKVDRMSMANSLEVRSPLLDYRIAELAFSMPTAVKIPDPRLDGSMNKYVLKELASRYLGREYVYRPKEGFGIPVSRWLREDKAGYLRDALLSSSSPIYDYLDRAVVQNIVQSHIKGTTDQGAKLWNLLMFDGWCRHVHQANQQGGQRRS